MTLELRSGGIAMEYAIELEGLTKRYGKKRGIRDVSLSVKEGDIFGFLGPNGAGKSTSIRCMLGLLHFDRGQIRLLGMDAAACREAVLGQVGYVPSEPQFYPGMRAKEVISFAARARGLDCRREAERICEALGVEQEKRIWELSLGNRKKVSLVCAMQHRPKLLILDEPTSGLDPLMQEAFWRLILDYNRQGMTCFLSSHVLPEVKKYCKNAAVIREGEVILTDSMEHLSGSGVRRVKVWKDGKEEIYTYSGEIKALIARLHEQQVDDVLIEEPELEEQFISYYNEEKKDAAET